MDTAGIDFGSTLIKIYWRKGGEDRYATASGLGDMPPITGEMHRDGVRRVRVTGIRGASAISHMEEGFTVVGPAAGAVDDEIRLQAIGARRLMGASAPKRLIVASVGTGVSYAKVKGDKAKRLPIGNCHGGGTMLGLARLIGARTFQELEAAAAKGDPADLLVRHQVPALSGSDIGRLVIAHFWGNDARFENRCAGVFSLASASIAKDLAILTAIPFSPKDIVLVGTVAASPVFRRHLEGWAPLLKKCRLHFPRRGEYAAAVGAWADISA